MEKKGKDAVKKPWLELRIPFSFKLTIIVTLILLGSIWIITTLMGLMVSSEFIRTAEDTNFAINSRAASGFEERLYKIRSEGLLLLETCDAVKDNSFMATQTRNIFFERNPYIAAVIVPGDMAIINQPFLAHSEIPQENLSVWLDGETSSTGRANLGDSVIRNATPAFGINLLVLFYPWQNSGHEESVAIFFSPQNLSEFTGLGFNTTVIANEEGDVLISPDFNRVLGGENMSNHALFEALWKAPGESIRLNYSEAGNRYVGSGHRVSLANAAVFSSLDYSVVTEQITGVTRRNILLSVTVMFLSILVTWFFSRIITTPLKRLMTAAGQIEAGEFNLDLKPKARDELGALTERFVTMGQGLGRLEEIKNLVGRFNNQKITDKAIDGTIKLSGDYLPAVVLSVDLVSFYNTLLEEIEAAPPKPVKKSTAKSSKLKKPNNPQVSASPEDINSAESSNTVYSTNAAGTVNADSSVNPAASVKPEDTESPVAATNTKPDIPWEPSDSLDHLNLLISKIADNVEKTGGVVDKVTGSSLLAVWGVPFPSDDIANEVMNSLRSVLLIRSFLWDFNTDRESQGKSWYKIQCGIHTGKVLAGCIGSSRFRQYSVAGKTVNEAIKIVEVCSQAKTDIIITEAVRDLAGDQILAEEIKGLKQFKSNGKLFGLVNLAPSPGQEKRWPFTLKDIQESLKEKSVR